MLVKTRDEYIRRLNSIYQTNLGKVWYLLSFDFN